MNQILIFMFGAVVGGFFVWVRFRKSAPADMKKENKPGLIEREMEEKQRNLEAIMGLLESGNGPLTNNHVEQMLGISDATAERYLEELEKQGKVRQVGKTGQAVYYEKV